MSDGPVSVEQAARSALLDIIETQRRDVDRLQRRVDIAEGRMLAVGMVLGQTRHAEEPSAAAREIAKKLLADARADRGPKGRRR